MQRINKQIGNILIYDTFVFFNELDLLEIRLNILNDHVDRFVLVEATRTFQGKSKPLYFEENKQRFAKFKDKIIHVIVDDLPVNSLPFDREHFQRDAILRGLSDCSSEDLIILSDLDEIPNPEVIPKHIEKGRIALFIQKLFYYTLNTKCAELEILPWSLIVNFDEIGSPAALRKRVVAYHSAMLSKAALDSSFKIIENGGWHFSYLGGPAAIRTKIEAFSHDELNVDEFKSIHNIQMAIANGRDIFGRKLTFVNAADDELPKFIVENFSTYKNKGLLVCSSVQKNNDTSASESTLLMSSPIIFDQYSRYKACSDLLRQTGFSSGNSILDIGSGPECLFGQFMPEATMNYVDPLIPVGSGQGRITGNVFSKELEEQTFDCVSAVDVLEHVPPEYRHGFLERMSSLGKNTLILGFPTSDSSVAFETDKAIDDQYRAIFGHNYPWLEEHYRFGLPSLTETVAQLSKLGWHCQTIGHGHAPWLRDLLSFVICAWDIPSMKDVVLEISEKFNRELYQYDFRAPYYRQFVIATRRPLPPITTPVTNTNNAEAENIFQKIMEDAHRQYFSTSLQQLVERDVYIAELNNKIEEASAWGKSLQASVIERDAYIANINMKVEEVSTWAKSLQAALVERDATIATITKR